MEENLFARDPKRPHAREVVPRGGDASPRVSALERRLARLMKGASRLARKRR